MVSGAFFLEIVGVYVLHFSFYVCMHCPPYAQVCHRQSLWDHNDKDSPAYFSNVRVHLDVDPVVPSGRCVDEHVVTMWDQKRKWLQFQDEMDAANLIGNH